MKIQCSKVSTTPLRQWGFRQCLPFSWTTLRGKHCRHPIAVIGVVDTFGLFLELAIICCASKSDHTFTLTTILYTTDLQNTGREFSMLFSKGDSDVVMILYNSEHQGKSCANLNFPFQNWRSGFCFSFWKTKENISSADSQVTQNRGRQFLKK